MPFLLMFWWNPNPSWRASRAMPGILLPPVPSAERMRRVTASLLNLGECRGLGRQTADRLPLHNFWQPRSWRWAGWLPRRERRSDHRGGLEGVGGGERGWVTSAAKQTVLLLTLSLGVVLAPANKTNGSSNMDGLREASCLFISCLTSSWDAKVWEFLTF